MNKISFIVRCLTISLVLLISTFNAGLAHIEVRDDSAKFAYPANSEEALRERIENIQTAVDLRFTPQVAKSIRSYTSYKKGTEKILGRAAIYFPLFEQVIREKNVPDELKFLAIVESHLDPKAVSKFGAVGMWQFMPKTAAIFDLEMNSVVDQRMDPIQSTAAAMDYLKDLHRMFGDWTLALAAYNCGPGNVRKAIRRSGSKDYWKLRSHLPKETQAYIPKFVAVCYLYNYYYVHNLNPNVPDRDLQYTAQTQVYDKTSFQDISDRTGISQSIIKQLNPSYKKSYIPASEQGKYNLILPEKDMLAFLMQDGNIPFENTTLSVNIAKESLEVEAHENQKSIVEVDETRDAEREELIESKKSRAHHDGLPVVNSIPPVAQALVRQRKKADKTRYEYYRLSEKESIIDLAMQREDLSLHEIITLNDLSIDNLPSSGALIRLRRL